MGPLLQPALASNLLMGQNLVDGRALFRVLVEAEHDEVINNLLLLVVLVLKHGLHVVVLNLFLQVIEVLAYEGVLTQRAHLVEENAQ